MKNGHPTPDDNSGHRSAMLYAHASTLAKRKPKMTPKTHHKMIECVIPSLKVKSIEAGVAFYSEVLGFSKDWSYEKDGYSVAGISRDGLSIYLSEGSEGTRVGWIWIGLEDDSLFDRIMASAAEIVQEPKNYSYACEMRIKDPDGHTLQLGTEPRE